MKVVINRCYGGFGLSHKAVLRYAELKGIKVYPEENKWGRYTYWTTENKVKRENNYSEYSIYDRDISRNDPDLVQVVEELRSEASDNLADLRIVEIPDDVEWEIDDYDGMESVEEVHRSWS